MWYTLYQWAGRKNKWYLLFLSFLLLSAIGAGGYYGICILDQKISYQKSRLNDLCAQLSQQVKRAKEYEQLKENAQPKTELERYRYACVPSFNQEQITTILALAKAHTVLITDLEKKSDQQKDWYCCSKLEIGLQASLAHIAAFLNALSKTNKLMQCKSFSCQKHEQSYKAQCTIGCMKLTV